jgi:flagellar biosynthetic protein FliQ
MVLLLLLPALVVGLLISMFQAATQINEATLSFIPKLAVTLATILLAGPWIVRTLVDYTQNLIESIPYLIG